MFKLLPLSLHCKLLTRSKEGNIGFWKTNDEDIAALLWRHGQVRPSKHVSCFKTNNVVVKIEANRTSLILTCTIFLEKLPTCQYLTQNRIGGNFVPPTVIAILRRWTIRLFQQRWQACRELRLISMALFLALEIFPLMYFVTMMAGVKNAGRHFPYESQFFRIFHIPIATELAHACLQFFQTLWSRPMETERPHSISH